LECQASNRCPKFGQDNFCNKSCYGYLSLQILFEQSQIPLRFQNWFRHNIPFSKRNPTATKAIRNYINNFPKHLEKGEGLYFFGQAPGTGKTTAACIIGNEFILANTFAARQRCQVLFVNCSELMERLRKAINFTDDGLAEYLHLIDTVPLLILDDIGAERPSDWVRERFYNIINRRYNNLRPIIFTSNLSLDELEVNLGERIRSRVEGIAFPVCFESKQDMRRRVGIIQSAGN